MSFQDEFSASKAIGSKDYDEAINAYKRMLAENYENAEAMAMLAFCYEWKGDMEESIFYARKYLVCYPNNLNMLLLSARYWVQKEDEEQTYHFVCRALENKNEKTYEIPEWAFHLMKPLSVFKRFRGLEEKSRNSEESNRKYREDLLEWAKEYKAWYESKAAAE